MNEKRYVVILKGGGTSLEEARGRLGQGNAIYELGPEVKEPNAHALIAALQAIRDIGGCGCLPERTCPQHIALSALKAAGIE